MKNKTIDTLIIKLVAELPPEPSKVKLASAPVVEEYEILLNPVDEYEVLPSFV